jgi:hypothetical protein
MPTVLQNHFAQTKALLGLGDILRANKNLPPKILNKFIGNRFIINYRINITYMTHSYEINI